jgi:hypothetical protein
MYDSITAAKHELGHALVQTLVGIGPQAVKIWETEEGWQGQSLPFEGANCNELFNKLLVSQLAGPIAQICSAPESLGDFSGVFSIGLLEPALELGAARLECLNHLLWASDLERHVLPLASTFRFIKCESCFYQKGAFVFQAEECLFRAFNDDQILGGMGELAKTVANIQSLETEQFREIASDVLSAPAWSELLALDLDFPPPFNFKD